MIIIKKPTELHTVWEQRRVDFKEMIKAVVDVEQEIIGLDAELHSDLENLLIEAGSRQKDLWGINLYPAKSNNELIEYTSFINIRPSQDNRSMEVQNSDLRERIRRICERLLKR
jgi:hypothetical protein